MKGAVPGCGEQHLSCSSIEKAAPCVGGKELPAASHAASPLGTGRPLWTGRGWISELATALSCF